MKKIVLPIMIAACAASINADDLTKNVRRYISDSHRVEKLPLSPEALKKERMHMRERGQNLHDTMAQSENESHQDSRMPIVKKHIEKHDNEINNPKKIQTNVRAVAIQD